MARYIYESSRIVDTLKKYRQIYNYYKDESFPETNTKDHIYIPFPRLNPAIAESLVRTLINQNRVKLGLEKVRFSQSGGDLVAYDTFANCDKTIEVKSTGKQAFQYLTDKDLNADYIIWVHFGDYFFDGEKDEVEIYIIKKPTDSLVSKLPKSRKVSLTSLIKKMRNTSHNYCKKTINMSEFSKL